jgi:hypothetical protein
VTRAAGSRYDEGRYETALYLFDDTYRGDSLRMFAHGGAVARIRI